MASRNTISPADVRTAIVLIAGAVACTWGLYYGLHVAPLETELKLTQKIFYFHAPLGIWTIVITVVAAGSAIAYLAGRWPVADLLSASCMEVATLGCAVVLVTGSLWAKPAWGDWFPWGEPRVTGMLVLFLIGLAYRVVRSSVDDDDRRGRFSAVMAIIGALDALLAYAAIHIWNTTHPRVITPGNIGLEHHMKIAFFICIAGTGLLCWGLVAARTRLARAERDIDELLRATEDLA